VRRGNNMKQKSPTELLAAASKAVTVADDKREKAIEAIAEAANRYIVVTSTHYLWGSYEFAIRDLEHAIEALIATHRALCNAQEKECELEDKLEKWNAALAASARPGPG